MNTTELIRPPAAPTLGQTIAELVPLVDTIAGYGPPVIFLAGPWLLLGLMLSAPFAVLLTLIAAMLLAAAVAVALVAALVALVVAPYRLVRRARRAYGGERTAPLVPVPTPGAVA
jgi:hypothetical protein